MGLGAKVKNTLLDWLKDLWEWIDDKIINALLDVLGTILDLIEKPLIGMISWEWKALSDEEEPPPQLKELLRKGEESKQIAFLPILVAVAGALGMALIMAIAATFMTKAQQEVNQRVSTGLLPADLVAQGVFRGILTPDDVTHHMGRAGIDPATTQFYQDILRPRSQPFDYIRMWLRGEFSDSEVDEKLGELGFAENEIEVFKTLAFYIPPVPDLTRMAVREAFTPEIVEKYELDSEFPEDFANYAAQQGVSEEWAKNYWRAHWELPSITMAFEMLHRGEINEEELDVLLKTLDVMKFWRPKIKAISYRPFTRVDVRRMYRVGVLDETQVERAYLDLGYDREKARAMTDFTMQFEKQSQRDLSKAELLRGYREGILDRATVKSSLTDMGYDEDESEFYLQLEDVKLSDETLKFKIDLAVTRYRAGEIDDNGLLAALGELNLPAEQQELIVEKEQLRKEVKDKQPTKDEVIGWYRADIIEESKAIQYLSAMKYSTEIIDLYLVEVPKAPSAGSVLRWLINGYIDEGTARAYLAELRYGKTEIDLLIEEATVQVEILPKLPPLGEVKKWFIQELITEQEARNYLIAMRYGDKEVNLFIEEWTPEPE